MEKKIKKIVYVMLAVTLLLAFAYLIFLKTAKNSIDPINFDNKRGEAPGWLQVLPDYGFGDIEKDGDTYLYRYQKETTDNGQVERLVEYTKNDTGKYQGVLTLNFSATEKTFVEKIPKSFATHIDQLEFSVEPSRIIDPDPIVEFADVKGEVVIQSKEIVDVKNIEKSIEEQLLDTEFARCEKLEEKEKYICGFNLIAKYRDSEILYNEFKDIKQDQFLGAATFAVIDKDVKKCSGITDIEHKNLCYEYVYQVLVDECNSKTSKDYRDCVRQVSYDLPNMEMQRLFCYYIDDLEMYNECLGKADLKVCNEIDNYDKRLLCQMNITRVANSLELCQTIKDTEVREACLAMLGADNLNKDYCALIKDDYLDGVCKTKIAMVKNDKTLCSQIRHTDSKDLCYGHFVLNKKFASQAMCDDINEEFIKDMCELVLAVQEKNTKKCDSYSGEDEHTKATCYFAIAVKHNDASFCSKIITTDEEDLLEAEKKSKDACFAIIAINLSDLGMCDKIEDSAIRQECIGGVEKSNEPEPEISLPAMPDWMDCPIPEGAKLKTWNNFQQSGYRYTDPNAKRKRVGPSMEYWGTDFAQPYIFMCYNADGEKHGPFKTYNQIGGGKRKEGHYKNNKLDQEVREYTNGVLRSIWTYTYGVKNGPASYYCTVDACTKGSIMSEGPLVNNQKHGMWTFYKHGNFAFKSEYINGEVTRDESGMNIRYY